MFLIFICSIKSVATILLASCAGILLVKYKVLGNDAIRTLSKIVFLVTLPALLATKVASSIDLDTLYKLWPIPISAFVFVFTGFILSKLSCIIFKIPQDSRGVVRAASSLGNSGYIPIPLIIAICAIFPIFIDDPNASDRGITYISAYLMVLSPLLWVYGYNTIAGRAMHKLKLKYFFPPPVIGILIGLTIGLIPFLNNTFCLYNGFCFPIFESWKILAAATIPLALIVLGGRFAIPDKEVSIDKKIIITVALLKLIVLPIFAIGYIFILRHFKIISLDPILALVLIIEAAVPPANNLILMASLHKKNEGVTAKTLFWCYLLSTISLTIFISVGMILFS